MQTQTIDLSDFIAQYSGNTITYCANTGNAGDALIHEGQMQLFRDNNVTIRPMSCKDKAVNQTIFYSGGGNLNDLYNDCADFLMNNASAEAGNVIVLLPHSIFGRESLLSGLPASVTIICRDMYSYRHVMMHFKHPTNVWVSHDAAFYLRVPELLMHDPTLSSGEGTLDAFRTDSESKDPQIEYDHGRNVDVSRIFPDEKYLHGPKRRQCAIDFFEYLVPFEHVRTNRLHVAIGAALLGKRVDMYPNSYFKNKAVFEHSFAHFGMGDQVYFHDI